MKAHRRTQHAHAARCTQHAARYLFALLFAVGCGGDTPIAPTTPPFDRTAVFGDAVLVGAGDIAVCNSPGAPATASLLDGISGTVFTAGDDALFSGTAEEFRACYEPTWGRHKARTRPAPGNHEYDSPGAFPYFQYFGPNAGQVGLGYYSYDLGGWHVISLNSNVPADAASPQALWLQQNLDAHRTGCTAAYWHHPLFSSGPNGNNQSMYDVWRLLYAFGVDVVINGHDHAYERFAPMDPDGRADPARGIREFVVGTGGAPLYGHPRVQPHSEVRASLYGVLKLSLHTTSYDWGFVPVPGQAFRDNGSGVCH